ncbi:MAG TPA: hypothetical protein VFT72_17890 [Opitutaceae bacterium]|nr:hypothetical protein [Opitutaceae bacterium]
MSLGDANALYFTAGPKNEEDGLFGRLNSVALNFKIAVSTRPPVGTVSRNISQRFRL